MNVVKLKCVQIYICSISSEPWSSRRTTSAQREAIASHTKVIAIFITYLFIFSHIFENAENIMQLHDNLKFA